MGTPIITVARSIAAVMASASKPGRKTSAAPEARATLVATKRPCVWKIGRAWISRSWAVKRQTSRSASALEARLAWLSMAPLERPVVPEV